VEATTRVKTRRDLLVEFMVDVVVLLFWGMCAALNVDALFKIMAKYVFPKTVGGRKPGNIKRYHAKTHKNGGV
jgi:hypothetical protein